MNQIIDGQPYSARGEATIYRNHRIVRGGLGEYLVYSDNRCVDVAKSPTQAYAAIDQRLDSAA